MAATLVLETNAFGRGGSSPSSGTKIFDMREAASMARYCLENSATVMSREGSIPSLPAKFYALVVQLVGRRIPNPLISVRVGAGVPTERSPNGRAAHC